MSLHTYDTVSEFAAAVHEPYDPDYVSWLGGLTPRQAMKAATDGHNDAVAGAEAFMAKIEHSMVLPDTFALQTRRGVIGGRADMGAWLAGTPDPMRRRTRSKVDTAPLKIVVGTFVSAGISADSLKRRGEAILAFVMLAQRVRPVDLYVVGESTNRDGKGWRYFYIRLESRPISLSQAGFVIGHPAFFRVLGNGWFIERNNIGRSVPCVESTKAEQRERLGLAPTDILIDKAALYDELISNPLAWIQRELTQIMEVVQ